MSVAPVLVLTRVVATSMVPGEASAVKVAAVRVPARDHHQVIIAMCVRTKTHDRGATCQRAFGSHTRHGHHISLGCERDLVRSRSSPIYEHEPIVVAVEAGQEGMYTVVPLRLMLPNS